MRVQQQIPSECVCLGTREECAFFILTSFDMMELDFFKMEETVWKEQHKYCTVSFYTQCTEKLIETHTLSICTCSQ